MCFNKDCGNVKALPRKIIFLQIIGGIFAVFIGVFWIVNIKYEIILQKHFLTALGILGLIFMGFGSFWEYKNSKNPKEQKLILKSRIPISILILGAIISPYITRTCPFELWFLVSIFLLFCYFYFNKKLEQFRKDEKLIGELTDVLQ